MSLRVSKIMVQLVVIDEYDAILEAQPNVFQGDADSTALDKAAAFLAEVPAKLAEAEGGSTESPSRVDC